MPPRLTIVGINFAPESNGNAPYTTSLAQGMAAMGWEVKVVTSFPHYPQWKIYDGYDGRNIQERYGEVDVLRLRHYIPQKPRFINRWLMEIHFGARAVLADWSRPDVVLLVSPALFSSAIAAARTKLSKNRPGTAIWVHDLYSQGLEEAHASTSAVVPVMHAIEKAILSGADKVIAIHDRLGRRVIQGFGVEEERVRIHRNWSHIPPQPSIDRVTARARFGWSDDEIVVLHAGNMGVKQGLENVIEAARLAGNTSSKVRFVLLGTGSQREKLESLGQGIDRLQFIDPLPDDKYAAALASADILLVNEKPGIREMCVPSKLTSYFTTGRPVLAAVEDESATAGEVEASKAGRVIPSGDPAELLRTAEQMGADRAASATLGSNGPRYATEHLSKETAMRRWDEALRSLTQHVDR